MTEQEIRAAEQDRYNYLRSTPARSLRMVGDPLAASATPRHPGPWHIVLAAYQVQGYLHDSTQEFVPIGRVYSADHGAED